MAKSKENVTVPMEEVVCSTMIQEEALTRTPHPEGDSHSGRDPGGDPDRPPGDDGGEELMSETLDLIQGARQDLKTIMVELTQAEYLLNANLPELAYLEEDIHAHVRTLASGLASLAKNHLEADGLVETTEQ